MMVLSLVVALIAIIYLIQFQFIQEYLVDPITIRNNYVDQIYNTKVHIDNCSVPTLHPPRNFWPIHRPSPIISIPYYDTV